MKHLKILLALTMICVCLSLAACGFDFSEEDYDSAAKIANGNKYQKTMAVKNMIGNSCEFSAGTMKGWDTVWSKSNLSSGEITVAVTLSVAEGKAKVVFIDADDKVRTLVECTADSASDHATQTLSVKSGNNRIKIVALDCKDLTMKLKVS